MNTYTYHIHHDEGHCIKNDFISPALTDAQLYIEYQSIETELHLYALSKNFALSCNTQFDDEDGISVDFRNFKSGDEADTFIREFPEWLKTRINTRFCPVIQKEEALS